MARSESSSKQGNSVARGVGRSNGRADAPASALPTSVNEWISGSLSAAQQAMRWVQPANGLGSPVSTAATEAFLKGMSDLGRANDPMGFMAAYSEWTGRQWEEWSKPMAAAMQQWIDMQFQWAGQLEKMISSPAAGKPSKPVLDEDGRTAWLQAQDNWLAMTQAWIDSSLANTKSK